MAFGVGLTKTVAVVVGPTQPLAVGVMVNVTVIGAKVVLVNVPLMRLPEPVDAMPVTVPLLSLIHVKVVPVVLLVRVIVFIAKPEQTV